MWTEQGKTNNAKRWWGDCSKLDVCLEGLVWVETTTDSFAERGSWKGRLKGKLWGFNTDLEVTAGQPKRAAMQAVLDEELKFCREDRMLMGFRSGYPQIEHLGILSCFTPKDSENSMCRKDSLTFAWSGSSALPVPGALPLPRGKKHPYLWRQGTQTEAWTNRPS